MVKDEDYENVVELGAGTAPITRLLAEDPSSNCVRLIVCDNRPDAATYADLEQRFPGRVIPRYEPVDFSKPQAWPPKTIVYLSGTFHHVPEDVRLDVLATLTKSSDRVVIIEPLRKTLLSIGFVFLSTVPAFILPLWYLRRPGTLRRFFWCWLVPIAPIMFWWDGVASCLRMWTETEWRANLHHVLPPGKQAVMRRTLFSQLVAW
jgi:hypothetical protein